MNMKGVKRVYENEFCLHDNILLPVTYDDLILMAQNINPASGVTLRDEFKKLLKERVEDALEDFDAHIDEMYEAAFPDERGELQNAPGWDSERLEALAHEIYQWLRDHDMWIDVCIYYDGKRMCTDVKDDNGEWVFRYNGEPFIEEDVDPRDYFEYVADPHIISMSFEGALYEVLNGYCAGWTKLEAEFSELLSKHGLYYELGHAWNLSCWEVQR